MVKWLSWIPTTSIPTKFDIIKILNNTEGLFITLKSDTTKKTIIFNFNGFLTSVRCTKRVDFLKTISQLKKANLTFFCNSSLFKAENSNYLKWIEEESYGFFKASEVFHYVFLGQNIVFEVLAPYEPEITIIDNNVENN